MELWIQISHQKYKGMCSRSTKDFGIGLASIVQNLSFRMRIAAEGRAISHLQKNKIGDLNPCEVTAFRAELYPLIMISSMTQRLMRGLQQESRMGRIKCNSESTNKKWISHTISCVPDTYTGSTDIRDEGHQSRTRSSLNWRIHSSHDMAGEIWWNWPHQLHLGILLLLWISSNHSNQHKPEVGYQFRAWVLLAASTQECHPSPKPSGNIQCKGREPAWDTQIRKLKGGGAGSWEDWQGRRNWRKKFPVEWQMTGD